MVESLTTAASPARRRYDQAVLNTTSTTVASNGVFPSCELRRCPVEHGSCMLMCLVLVPSTWTVIDFAKDVGISTSHMSEVVHAKPGRHTCHSWQGALLSSAGAARVSTGQSVPVQTTPRGGGDVVFMSPEGGGYHAPDGSYIQTVPGVNDMGSGCSTAPAPGKTPKASRRHDRLKSPYRTHPVQRAVAPGQYWLAPQHPDRSWYAGLLSRELVTPQGPLMPEGCPARARFDRLILTFPNGVPLEKIFPKADLSTSRSCGRPTVRPQCPPRNFGEDVGVRSRQHLSEMLRGARTIGESSCCGWIGALDSPQGETPPVDVPPTPIEIPLVGHIVQPLVAVQTAALHGITEQGMVDFENWDLTADYLTAKPVSPSLSATEVTPLSMSNEQMDMLVDMVDLGNWDPTADYLTAKPVSPSLSATEVTLQAYFQIPEVTSTTLSMSNEQMDMLVDTPSVALALFPSLNQDPELLQALAM